MPFTWDPATGDVTTAVDGFPINEPFWGGTATAGQDWYELNFGSARTFDEVRLYFKDSRPASGTYRAPASYDVQYHDGSTWVSASSQVKNPATPRGNYNVVRFNAVNAQRMRVVFNAVSGARTGLTEIKVHNRGGGTPQPSNLAQSAVATASYTSPWESVAAVNDGIDPPSSNDTVNPRWGCWPETGQQWVELTWPSAGTLNRAEVYFFDDDQGIDMPASWKLQYWNGSAYADVPGASAYTLAKDADNTVTFTAVNTTRLRVLLTGNGTSSVGLLEVKAYGT